MRKVIAVLSMAIGLLVAGGTVAHADYINNYGVRTVTPVNNSHHKIVVKLKVQVKRYDSGKAHSLRSAVSVHCYGKYGNGSLYDATCERQWIQQLMVYNPRALHHQFAVKYLDAGGSAKTGSWRPLNKCRDYYVTHMAGPLIEMHGQAYGLGGRKVSGRYTPTNKTGC